MWSLLKTAFCRKRVLLLAIVGGILSVLPQRTPAVRCDDIEQMQQLATQAGLHWRWGNIHNQPCFVLFVSERPLAWEEIVALQEPGATRTANWRGIAWIMWGDPPPTFSENSPMLAGAQPRLCGKMLVGGDEELMHRIEEFCTEQRAWPYWLAAVSAQTLATNPS